MFVYGFWGKEYVFDYLLEPAHVSTDIKLSFANIKKR